MGLLPGGGRDTGRSGSMQMDGLDTGETSTGTGTVSGTGTDGGRVGRGSDVPGSLRAYVRRYLRALEERRARTRSSDGSD
jgi:hypothetical protein